MATKKKEEKKLTKDQALKKLEILKKDLFNIRFKKVNGQLDDTSKTAQIKIDVAKLLTKLHKKN